MRSILGLMAIAMSFYTDTSIKAFERIKYNHPGLTVDLGVGLWAWPLPMDWDSDGDLDLIVSCPDKPYHGSYFFENTGDDSRLPVFQAGVRVSGGVKNAQVSYVNGQPRVLKGQNPDRGRCVEFVNFLGEGFNESHELDYPAVKVGEGRVRANQWKYVDFDDDGALDLIHGAGFWGDYGWDNAFDSEGEWQRGPLHGYVYVLRNKGSNKQPDYETAYRLQAAGKDVDVYGMPSPNFADFDGDGDLDLLCGEFLDGFTYFENVGTRSKPEYSAGVYLTNAGKKVAMHVQMITPVAIDWDRDGDIDLVCGDEDGRVAFVENTGAIEDGTPLFEQPVYFQQVAEDVKFGALVTPFGVDWDNDGDEDLICGNTSGNIGFIENLDGGYPPKWAAPELLVSEGETIHIQAGPTGSIQGPCEAKWGYTVLNVADWDHDGLHDLVVNSIWGKVIWYKNTGTKHEPQLAAARPVQVEWADEPMKPTWNWWNPDSHELVTQWRTTPCVIDWDKDGLNDLVMLDHEGYLALFKRVERDNQLMLLPGKRIFHGGTFDNKHKIVETSIEDKERALLRLTRNQAGASGRRKLCFSDWTGDGNLDLLVNSENTNLLENVGTRDGKILFKDRGKLGTRTLAGHSTCPTTVDWNRDGKPDLVCGAEDGRLYYLQNPNSEEK